MNTIAYFIATGPSGNPGLWQKINDGDALELLEGVEHMQITYAQRATATIPSPLYRLASKLSANDWATVSSVRIELVIRSTENNVVETPQPYTFAGAVVNPADDDPTDRYLRQVFTSTLGIRSREN